MSMEKVPSDQKIDLNSFPTSDRTASVHEAVDRQLRFRTLQVRLGAPVFVANVIQPGSQRERSGATIKKSKLLAQDRCDCSLKVT